MDTIVSSVFSLGKREDTGGEGGADAGTKDKGKGGDESQEGGAGQKKGSWLRLFSLTLPELHWTLLGTIGAVVSGAMNPLFGLLVINVRASPPWSPYSPHRLPLLSLATAIALH